MGLTQSSAAATTHGGPCADHWCDACDGCRAGHCCGRDAWPEVLPGMEEADDPVAGDFGLLDADEETVACHVCGKRFAALTTSHLRLHSLTAAEYRSLFGLKRKQGLQSERTRERRRQAAGERLRPYQRRLVEHQPSPEQLVEFHRTRPVRLQTVREGLMPRPAACPECGKSFTVNRYGIGNVKRCGECDRERRSKVGVKGKFRRPERQLECIACGAAFTTRCHGIVKHCAACARKARTAASVRWHRAEREKARGIR